MNPIVKEEKNKKFHSIVTELIKDVEKYGNVTIEVDEENYKLHLQSYCFTSYFINEIIKADLRKINFSILPAEKSVGLVMTITIRGL